MESDWQEVNRIAATPPLVVGAYPAYPPALGFDPNAELLWVGNDQGYITSFNGVELQKYTSYRGHMPEGHQPSPTESAVRQLYFNDRGIISLASKSLHMSTRGGLAQWNLLDPRFQNLNSIAYTSRGQNEVLVAGEQEKMFTVNLEKGSIAAEISTDDEIKVMRRNNRYIVCGTSKGHVRLLDMSTYKVVKEFEHAHTGGIMDMDTHDNWIVTCGFILRQGNYVQDPLVKLYDIRMQRAMPPVSFPGASFIRMHPKMSSAAIIASATGQFQEIDLANATMMKMRQANVPSYITGMELAPTGDALALMDAGGCVQLWGSPGKIQFTEFATPLDIPVSAPLKSTVGFPETFPLNKIGMPYYHEELLSVWPSYPVYEMSMQPQKIDADILEATKNHPYGVAPYNKRLPRNYVPKNRASMALTPNATPAPKFLSEQSRTQAATNTASESTPSGDESRRQFEAPRKYKYHNIMYSRFGVDDFDFMYYNKTQYSGLETHIPNSYMNPLLQLYRFTPLLRNVALHHAAGTCTKDDCVLCQMGYVFDMLEKANGRNCQATNFLRTLSAHPSAAKHGILEDESLNAIPPTVMMQRLNRFLLDQAIHDQKMFFGADEPELSTAVTIKAVKSQRCNSCGKESKPLGDSCATDLVYSQRKKPSPPAQNFATIVKQSIQPEINQKGWCDKCRRYQHQHIKKSIKRLPEVVALNATTSEKSMALANDYWALPGWLPEEIGIAITGGAGNINAWQGDALAAIKSKPDGKNLQLYELVGFVVEIRSDEDRQNHLIAFINVALSSVDRQEGDANWHVFNDFRVEPVSKEEALDFSPKWKMPSVLLYQLKSEACKIDNSWRDKIDTWILYNDFSYMGRTKKESTIVKLSPDEAPRKGTLIALDAEFVQLQQGEAEIKADGTKMTVRPQRDGLARVSVLRGQGLNEGVPFIDDYIHIKERVVNYVTEFSGIRPGDLDPERSEHAVISLKVAYKRLWILLNLGCIFVGHGLLKDFRIINIRVPREQVLDTVDLFALPQEKRKLSLRFLAWVVLEEQIQQETHDSIEDARTALKLYRKHEEYVSAGVLDEIFDHIVATGTRTGYKPPALGNDSLLRVQAGFVDENSVPRSEAATPQPRVNVNIT